MIDTAIANLRQQHGIKRRAGLMSYVPGQLMAGCHGAVTDIAQGGENSCDKLGKGGQRRRLTPVSEKRLPGWGTARRCRQRSSASTRRRSGPELAASDVRFRWPATGSGGQLRAQSATGSVGPPRLPCFNALSRVRRPTKPPIKRDPRVSGCPIAHLFVDTADIQTV